MILVVDDEPSNRRTLKMVLEREEHTVLEAENGRFALSILQNKAPKLWGLLLLTSVLWLIQPANHLFSKQNTR